MNEDKSVVICMGSSCFARGNRKNLEVVEKFIASHNLKVSVKLSGSRCAELCPKGPNVMINGVMYHQVDSGALIDLLNKHFTTTMREEA